MGAGKFSPVIHPQQCAPAKDSAHAIMKEKQALQKQAQAPWFRALWNLYPRFLICYTECYVFHYESYGLHNSWYFGIWYKPSSSSTSFISDRPLSQDINLKDMTMFAFYYNSSYLWCLSHCSCVHAKYEFIKLTPWLFCTHGWCWLLVPIQQYAVTYSYPVSVYNGQSLWYTIMHYVDMMALPRFSILMTSCHAPPLIQPWQSLSRPLSIIIPFIDGSIHCSWSCGQGSVVRVND